MKTINNSDPLPSIIKWECVKQDSAYSSFGDNIRAKVIGGWLMRIRNSMVFIPDPQHQWKLDKC
jgi:hypothetical protein